MTGEPFIPASLDDYGLTAAQFRVYCHIARRGECYASAKTIAQICRLHRDSVWSSLAFLVGQRLLAQEIRPGATTVFRLTPVEEWKPAGNHLTESKGQPSDSATGCRKARVDHLTESKGHKGSPSEGSPLKGILSEVVEIPKELQTAAFVQAWGEWLEYSRSFKKKRPAISLRKNLKWLNEQHRRPHAVEIIGESIRNTWQGLFDLKKPSSSGNQNRGISASAVSTQPAAIRRLIDNQKP